MPNIDSPLSGLSGEGDKADTRVSAVHFVTLSEY